MASRPTAILWDHDGVLVDTEPLYYRANRDALAQAGVELTVENYRQLYLIEARGAWHLAEARGVPPEKIRELRAARDQMYLDMLRQGNFFVPGALELLERLKSSYRQAVVTTSHRVHFDAIHNRTRLRELVEFVLVREDYAESKPHPEPYLLALRRLGLPADQCIVIEDSERGLRSACAANLRCWVVQSELTAELPLAQADRRFPTLRELGECLLAWAADGLVQQRGLT